MLSFLIFLLSSIGLTLIVTQSYIFKPIRKIADDINPHLGKLLRCTMCSGFWLSLIVQVCILFHQRMEFILYWSDLYYILYGFIGSFVCYMVYLLLKPLVDKYD